MTGSKPPRRPGRSGAWPVLVAALAAPLLTAAPALAQWSDEAIMPPQAIGRLVMRHGYSGFSPPRLSGDVYIVHAVDVDGSRVRLVIDAHDGRLLRPARVVEEFAPRRLRPRAEAILPEAEDGEREYIGRFGTPRVAREAPVPPRPVGREPLYEPPEEVWETRREARIDEGRAPLGPSERPSAADPRAAAPKGRSARIEAPPARVSGDKAAADKAASARPARKEANRAPASAAPVTPPAVAVTPPAPAPAVEPAKVEAKPEPATAAAPAPALPKEAPPVTPAAPPPAVEPAKPAPVVPETAKVEPPKAEPAKAEPAKSEAAKAEPKAEAVTSEPAHPASQDKAAAAPKPATTASASGAPVRVIGGVTPVLPQASDKGTGEPPAGGTP